MSKDMSMKKELNRMIEQSELVLIGIGSEMSGQGMQKNDLSYQELLQAYQNLFDMVKDKNYFVVTTNMDDIIWDTNFDAARIVAPCGGFRFLQCEANCNGALYDTMLTKCPDCGSDLIFCNKDAENYNENIYLSQWEVYTAWMQKTLNKKICIVELGEGLKYPTVIRWPFEKMAFINQKSVLFRVHSKLYQLTEELKERAHSIPMDPITFLKNV